MQNNRMQSPGANGAAVGLAIMFVLIGIAGVIVGAVHVGHAIDGSDVDVPADPFEVLFGLLRGRVPWPASGGMVLAVLGAVFVALAAGMVAIAVKARKQRTRVDRAARYMGTGRDTEEISKRTAAKKAARLGVEGAPGVPIGRQVGTGVELYGSWEDTHVHVWGPRTGKTSCEAIPAVLVAQGAVVATSNKRDLVDATRGPRSALGPVWVFDPQGLVQERPSWWWNPLSYVTDEIKADQLAGHFLMNAKTPGGSKSDAHFEEQGRALVAALLLAAAVARRPITDVWGWITRPNEPEPVDVLREHGFGFIADDLSGIMHAADDERSGYYSTGTRMTRFLTNRAITPWITANDDPARPHFDPHGFVEAGGTLYSLSKEGKGSAGPLVTALTVAVVEAAEEIGAMSPNGRLAKPLVCVLDEAANVCRWAELPDQYSHFGSRGIIPMTFLQSWSQGVEVWGESGMNKLWSAANVAVYGGGVREVAFLKTISDLIGEHDYLVTSTSSGRGGSSVNRQVQRQTTLTVDDLAALPRGRAIVLASGSRATMMRTQPWMQGPHAAAVKESIMRYDPQGAGVIAEHERQAAAVQDELAASTHGDDA